MELFLAKKQHRTITIIFSALLLMIGLYKGAYYLWGEHYLTFFKGIIQNPSQVGAASPCSTFVAAEITKYVTQGAERKKGPLRILEVGAGSGVFTAQLEKNLQHASCNYHIDAIEINHEYAQLLRNRFGNNPAITIHEGDIIDWQPEQPYDYIISSLPFSNIDGQSVAAILHNYEQLVQPDGIISYIEHRWLPSIKEYFLSSASKEEYKLKRACIAHFTNRFRFESVTVWANIPPVYVHHLRMPGI